MKLLLVILPSICLAVDPVCNSCRFNTTPANEPECGVFGSFGGDSLSPYHRASEECLAALDIDMAAVAKADMWNICPMANEVNAVANNIKFLLRDVESDASSAIKSMYPNFFEDVDGSFKLRQNITGYNNQYVDCTQTTTGSLCWNEIGIYFDLNSEERGKVCVKLHKLQVASLIEEQTKARELICSNPENENFTVACEPLSTQIIKVKEDNPGLACDQSRGLSADAESPTCTKKAPEKPETSSTSWEGTALASLVTWSSLGGLLLLL